MLSLNKSDMHMKKALSATIDTSNQQCFLFLYNITEREDLKYKV